MHEMQIAGREIVLHGSGLIGLGRSPAAEPEFGIRFAIQMPSSRREPMGNGSRPATSIEYGGFWRRFVAFVIDYVLVSLVLFALLAAAALVVPRIAESIDLSTFPFEVLAIERTVESKPAVVQYGEEGKKTQTEKIVESTVAGRWVYLHRVIETETEKKPSPQTILTTKSVKRIRLDPQTREEVHSVSMLYLFWITLLLYAVIMESSRFQATFGKMAMGIKVTNDDGGRPSILRALARNLLKILSAIILMIGFLMAAWTRRKQALHDMMARCCVVITSK
jgi:uncharacterized RDD family membrane protein YckC